MKKMWAGRTAGELNKIADKFNASIPFDQRLYRQDITGSIMHAEMLAAKGIIPLRLRITLLKVWKESWRIWKAESWRWI